MNAPNDKLSINLRAVSDPVRRKILKLLRSNPNKGLNASDIEGKVKLAQPTVSHHMKVLKRAGLIETKKLGTWVWYHRDPDNVRELQKSVAGL